MKCIERSILLVTLACCIAPRAASQSDTASWFYPFHDGNLWQFRSKSYFGTWSSPVYSGTHYYTLTVAGDTLLPNGKTYRKIQDVNTGRPVLIAHPWFQRIDTLSQQVFAFDTSSGGSEFLIDSLRALPGPMYLNRFQGARIDMLQRWTSLMRTDTQVVFGRPILCRTYYSGFPEGRHQYYTVAAGIGIIWSESGYQGMDMNAGDYNDDSLTYARVNGIEFGSLVGVSQDPPIPTTLSLDQNYPNPFNPATYVQFSVEQSRVVRLEIYDRLGRLLAVPFEGIALRGATRVLVDLAGQSSGAYFCRLVSGPIAITKGMLLLK